MAAPGELEGGAGEDHRILSAIQGILLVDMKSFMDLRPQFEEVEEEVMDLLTRCLRKGEFILGEHVESLEREFSRYVGVQYGVGVASGTDALHLALLACDIGQGDEVITVANTFISTALAISFAGARPHFIDIDSETYTMDPEKLREFFEAGCDVDQRTGKPIDRKTGRPIKAILPVHLYGFPADMDPILELASRYGLAVIEDACQAHGSEYVTGLGDDGAKRKGIKAGGIGRVGCFSFYPTKNLGAYGDGGMVVTDEEHLFGKLKMLRVYGQLDKDTSIMKGFNSRLDEIQAVILRVKLKKLDRWNHLRREKARLYDGALKDSSLILPIEREYGKHVYHLYVVRHRRRDALQDFLKEKGYSTLIHYPIPIHLQEAYRELGYREGDLPVTERCAREVLSLPLYPGMDDSDVEEICELVRAFGE
jgi:dTDP-4-amino-4,6-dideoxygalactose transaminase